MKEVTLTQMKLLHLLATAWDSGFTEAVRVTTASGGGEWRNPYRDAANGHE